MLKTSFTNVWKVSKNEKNQIETLETKSSLSQKKNAVEDTLADGNKWNEEFQGSNTKYIVKKKQNNT
jgi:hypothetical protein